MYFFIFILFRIYIRLLANSEDPDQDLGLHCLPMSKNWMLKKVSLAPISFWPLPCQSHYEVSRVMTKPAYDICE